MTGGISLFTASDYGWSRPLLLSNLTSCGMEGWDQIKVVLDSFMWIGMVQDKPGKALFDSMIARQEDGEIKYYGDSTLLVC